MSKAIIENKKGRLFVLINRDNSLRSYMVDSTTITDFSYRHYKKLMLKDECQGDYWSLDNLILTNNLRLTRFVNGKYGKNYSNIEEYLSDTSFRGDLEEIVAYNYGNIIGYNEEDGGVVIHFLVTTNAYTPFVSTDYEDTIDRYCGVYNHRRNIPNVWKEIIDDILMKFGKPLSISEFFAKGEEKCSIILDYKSTDIYKEIIGGWI